MTAEEKKQIIAYIEKLDDDGKYYDSGYRKGYDAALTLMWVFITFTMKTEDDSPKLSVHENLDDSNDGE